MLYQSSPPKEKEETTAEQAEGYVDEDAPAGIVGEQFFGGNKRKAEFYDPVAENEAGLTTEFELFDRFQDTTAFPDTTATEVARRVQSFVSQQANDELYSSNLRWESPFAEKNKYATPAIALKEQSSFYRDKLKIAILSAHTVSSAANDDDAVVVQVRWELAVRYPTLWEPSIVLTGTSTLDWNGSQITAQRDTLDNGDDATVSQFLPRFWDLYHIGMTPAAEDRTLTGSGSVVTIPPRWVWQVRYTDTDRESSNAAHLPNHAFTTLIKTMGPMKQDYATVIGIQVALRPSTTDDSVEITWTIPMSVGYAACPLWRMVPGEAAECVYIDQPQRFAVASYGGEGPQDEQISKARKRLYETAVKGGNVPVLSDDQRPKFSFGMNTVKACYTEGGLGMAVYEARPNLTRPNQVLLELEL